jgi:nitrate reductase NapE component
MSKMTINMPEEMAAPERGVPQFASVEPPRKKSRWRKFFLGVLAVLFAASLIAAVGGYFYWQSYKKTPAYALALVVDAARRDDQAAVERLIDADKVVENFLPQITEKAIDLYGRGLPPAIVQKVSKLATPMLPAVGARAKRELPALIREKTKIAENAPVWAIALSAPRYLEIKEEGDTATVVSKIPEKPLELKMQRNGDTWRVVEVKDEATARRIAERVGHELLRAAKGGVDEAGKKFGVNNLQDILRQASELFR